MEDTKRQVQQVHHVDTRAPQRGRLRVKSGVRAGAGKQKYLEVKLEDVIITSW